MISKTKYCLFLNLGFIPLNGVNISNIGDLDIKYSFVFILWNLEDSSKRGESFIS